MNMCLYMVHVCMHVCVRACILVHVHEYVHVRACMWGVGDYI